MKDLDRWISRPGAAGRRSVGDDLAGLVEVLPSDAPASPVRIIAQGRGVSLPAWLEANRPLVAHHLHETGALMFRAFAVSSAEDFRRAVASADEELLDYVYGSTPRTRALDKVYTSTEYPCDQTIPQHNEMSYATVWPARLWLWYQISARSGGQTPLADSRRVLARIDPVIADRFAQRGVMYVRNYGTGVDLTWQQTFETSDRGVVERYCAERGIRAQWSPDGALRTTQVCQAIATHPATGEQVWFNQAHLFHPSALPAAVRASLEAYAPLALPRNALFGDGTPIDDETLDEIRRAYAAETRAWDAQAGDVLLVDNMLIAHGRRPYEGERRVLVSMSGSTGGTR